MQLFYPYDSELLIRKQKSIRRELLASRSEWLDKRIAILGGSSTADIRKMMEIFLLSHGIRPEFYECEYAQYWQVATFGDSSLASFKPDILFVHTTNRNILKYPSPGDIQEVVDEMLIVNYKHFSNIWDKLAKDYNCPIIQNNFEYPYYRVMGNADACFVSGRTNFITKLNLKFYEYAQNHNGLYINDINWLSADYGLQAWSDPFYWYMYKYALCLPAIPRFAQNVANIIKSIYGKNMKAFALDLDNTLWSGVVGDDGVDNLEIGQETPAGQAFAEFQDYLKAHKQLGVILNVVSKNEHENALAGLNHPDNLLVPDDMVIIKANWEPKSNNLQAIAHELSLLPESFVFVDDNPAERALINQVLPNVPTPDMTRPEHYITTLDRNGFFEVTSFTDDDKVRGDMYRDNAARSVLQMQFTDYNEYLRSLEMNAEILPFTSVYFPRIAQLTNKSNQFNLTTLRCTQEEIEKFAGDASYITLYGKLSDKFGDNGIVSVIIGEIEGKIAHIRLWLMSCRVLMRNMEFAMMDELVQVSKERGITELRGYYYPTQKNGIVRDFYKNMRYEMTSEDDNGNTIWLYKISEHDNMNAVINVMTKHSIYKNARV
jgi:FkbH-like protein